MLVGWNEFLPLLRRITPRGAADHVEHIKEDYLAGTCSLTPKLQISRSG
jgi:hypothetical protein